MTHGNQMVGTVRYVGSLGFAFGECEGLHKGQDFMQGSTSNTCRAQCKTCRSRSTPTRLTSLCDRFLYSTTHSRRTQEGCNEQPTPPLVLAFWGLSTGMVWF